MNPFQGYEKMPDSLTKLGLSPQDMRLLERVEWVVTEKVHGANFSFVFDGERLGYAKRKEMLAWTDDFFAFQLVAERLDAAMMRLFDRIRELHPYDQAVVYGELYGGHYPHPEVPADERVQPIQTGIWYSPTVEFAAFDIAVERQGERTYLDFVEVMRLCEASGVPCVKPLHIGKLNDCLFFNTRFDSKVPGSLGLPELKPNLVEGIVVKPATNLMIPGPKTDIRPIFKIKNKEFAEEQFHEAQNWSYQHEGAPASERLMFLVPEVGRYVNANRLQSVISKIGGLSGGGEERKMQVQQALAADALETFWEENVGLREDLSDADLRWLTERVEALAGQCMSVMP
ncbi:MAG: RNA ligase family protein [Bacteroidia bacterium]